MEHAPDLTVWGESKKTHLLVYAHFLEIFKIPGKNSQTLHRDAIIPSQLTGIIKPVNEINLFHNLPL